eukprot:100272-Alexandrium_andersonii.AAC.1
MTLHCFARRRASTFLVPSAETPDCQTPERPFRLVGPCWGRGPSSKWIQEAAHEYFAVLLLLSTVRVLVRM